LKTIFRLIAKDYRLFWSDRVAVVLTFFIPIALILIWGNVFTNAGRGANRLRLAVLNESKSQIALKLERALDSSAAFRIIKIFKDANGRDKKFDTATIQEYVRKGSSSAALVIPHDALTDTSLGIKLQFFYDPKNEIEMQMIDGMLQKTVMENIPAVFLQSMRQRALQYLGNDSGSSFNNDIAQTVSKYFKIPLPYVFNPPIDSVMENVGDSSSEGGNIFNSILQLEKTQLVGQEIINPWATRSVGGWAMMFLLFTLTAASASLFDEKKSGVVLRLLASPVSRLDILWSKYVFNMSLGFLQLTVLFFAGALLFDIDIYSNFLNLLFIITAAAMSCTAFGMLLAAFSRTSAQANGYGTFFILAMSSIGGAWFPTALMPEFIQQISKGTIVYWSMEGFQQVLWRNANFFGILPNIGMLLLFAVLITSVSFWQFKKGHVF
jgi:ABC-2 type transport system permease protein